MSLFPFTLPRQFHRLTLKFVLEVAFSVAVTLAATKVIGLVMASPEVPKANMRAQVPSAAAIPSASQGESSQATPSPDMTRFMEKTAMAHVAVPWAEDVVTQAPVRAAILTSAPRAPGSPHGALVPVPPVQPASAQAASLQVAPLPPERPSARALASTGAPALAPALQASPGSNLVAVANPAPRPNLPPAPVASGSVPSPVSRLLVDIPRPPADISGTKPKPQKGLLARADDVKSSIVNGVSGVGASIGNTIGSLFKRN